MRLRPHHLLCSLTWVGRGYSAAFTAGMDDIIRRLAGGEEVEIVEGPDDICAPLLAEQTAPHCHASSVARRDQMAAADLEALLGPLLPGRRLRLSSTDIRHLRAAFHTGDVRTACHGCEWSPLCTALAADGFPGVRL